MPTKLSNFNFFIFQDRDSSVSRPLRVGGILWCRGRVGLGSCFRGRLQGIAGLGDEGIVCNRLKIAAAIQNTKAFLTVRKECGSFDASASYSPTLFTALG